MNDFDMNENINNENESAIDNTASNINETTANNEAANMTESMNDETSNTINAANTADNYTFRAEAEYKFQNNINPAYDNSNQQYYNNNYSNNNYAGYNANTPNPDYANYNAANAANSNYTGYNTNIPNQDYANYNAANNYYYGYAPMYQEPVVPPTKKEPSKVSRFFKKAGVVLASAAVFGLVAGACFLGTNKLYTTLNPDAASNSSTLSESNLASGSQLILDPVTDADMQIEATSLAENVSISSTDVSAVVEAAMPSIVAIQSTFNTQSWYGMYETTGGGSGIIVGENETELLIATNNHVIESATKIEVTFNDGSVYEAAIKGRDSVADLAVIAVKLDEMSEETHDAIRIATLGNSEDVKVGQMAIAIGNALGYGQSTTVGYISAKDREVVVDDSTMVLLQTDAAINPGNSGGALLNINGEVIGINSVKYASSDVEGMGFAIPISRATEILDDLMTREILSEDEQGYLGVYIQDVTSSIAAAYNWPVGIYVSELVEGGAAEEAGIYIGDIITAVNSTTVTTADALKEKVTSYRHGTVVTITLQRLVGGAFEEINLDVVLGQNVTATTESNDNVQDNTQTPDVPESTQPGRTRP